MPETTRSDLVERLRAYRPYDMGGEDRYHHAICDEAADEIARLQATVAKIQRSALTITETQRQIYDHYQKASTINKEAVGTLDSERAANAMLTEENERLRAHCEAMAKAIEQCERGALSLPRFTHDEMRKSLADYRKEHQA